MSEKETRKQNENEARECGMAKLALLLEERCGYHQWGIGVPPTVCRSRRAGVCTFSAFPMKAARAVAFIRSFVPSIGEGFIQRWRVSG